jgi:hypothetical protein
MPIRLANNARPLRGPWTGHIDEGAFNETTLDGLDWALLLYWPGEISPGNGTEQKIIDERADAAQREAPRKIPPR